MTTFSSLCQRRQITGLIATAGVCASVAAFAADIQSQEAIVVEADRPAAKVIGRSDLGKPIKLLQLSAQVSYADLDLSNGDNAKTLKQRVHDAAALVCKDLQKMYPEAETGDCAREAVHNASRQVEAAISAAQSGKGKAR